MGVEMVVLAAVRVAMAAVVVVIDLATIVAVASNREPSWKLQS